MVSSNTVQDEQLRIMARYNYGVALYHLGQDWAYERASTIFIELLDKLDSGHNLDDSRFLSLISSSLGVTYAKMACRPSDRKTELANLADQAADRVLEEMSAEKTSKSNALAAKGFARLSNDDFTTAISYFRDSLSENPGSIHSLLGLSEAYLSSGRREEALLTLKQAVNYSPLSGYAVYRLGNIYRELKEYNEAIETLKRAPEHAYARLLLGKIYQEDDRLHEALEEFRSASNLNSRLAEAWVNIAWTIHKLQNESLFKEAVIAARRGLQLERNRSQIWHRHAILAHCLLDIKKHEEAQREAKKSIELSDLSRPQAYYVLACAQYELGNYSQSIINIGKVIDLDKKGDWISDALSLRKKIQESSDRSGSKPR